MSRSDPLGPLLEALEAIAPLRLAAAWDNVGLLIEPISLERAHRILLTIDLTPSVLEEAVAAAAQLIVTYHPSPLAFNRFRAELESDFSAMALMLS